MSLYAPSIVAVDQFPTVDLTGLTSYSFNSSAGFDPVKHYAWRIMLEDVTPSAARDLWVRYSGVSGASTYSSILQFLKVDANTGQFLNVPGNAFQLTVASVLPSGTGATGFVDMAPGAAGTNPRFFSKTYYQDNSSVVMRATCEGMALTGGVASSFDLLLSGAGTFTKGKLYIQASRRA